MDRHLAYIIIIGRETVSSKIPYITSVLDDLITILYKLYSFVLIMIIIING